MSLKDKLATLPKVKPLKLASAEGELTHIKRLNPRESFDWFAFCTKGASGKPPTLDHQMARLFVRTCCDATGQLEYTDADIEKLRFDPAMGPILVEYYLEAIDFNRLYDTLEQQRAASLSFFSGTNGKTAGHSTSTESSTDSPPVGEKSTSKRSSTK